MASLQDYVRRIESSREAVLDLIRAYLGFGLFFRGLALLVVEDGLRQLAGGAAASLPTFGVGLYVTAAHLIGGALLAVGLYTRLAALVQIPVLVGAVTLVHWQDGLLSADQSLEFSVLVLFLLVLVALFGAGPWSLDARRNASAAEPGEAASA
jgi:uncharacterized membrane protein YphA (DoxX/SURF4 family)